MKIIDIKRKSGEIYHCLIDDDDYEKVNQYKWHIKKIGNNIYAEHWLPKNKTLLMHWLILDLKERIIDHKDCNGLNNQKSNLRYCNKSQNAINTKRVRGKSKYKGVSQAQSHGIYYNSWYAYAYSNNKRYFLGQFKTEKEAAIAYNLKSIELHGNFAKLNSI